MKKMKIAWISAAPYAHTGYGNQTKNIVARLKRLGWDITCIGGIGGATVWGGKMDYPAKIKESGNNYSEIPITVLPIMGAIGGNDVVPAYIEYHKFDICITLWDAFAVEYSTKLNVPVMNYFPVDAPMTQKMANMVKKSYKWIAMSKFGYNEMIKFKDPNKVEYLPHGINTKEYYPITYKSKREIRKELDMHLPDNAFLFLNVSANVGERKHLPQLLNTFKKLLKKNITKLEPYLFLFSNPNVSFPKGYDLLSYVRELGIEDRVIFPSLDPILEPWDSDLMNKLYNAGDCYVTPTIGEGFGIPLMESQATGLPVIMTDCSTAPELIGENGYLVRTIRDYEFTPVWIPTLQSYPVPNLLNLESCMMAAMHQRANNPISWDEKGFNCGKFAKKYDWEPIIPNWDKLLKKVQKEIMD